jgi:hypothetical protein
MAVAHDTDRNVKRHVDIMLFIFIYYIHTLLTAYRTYIESQTQDPFTDLRHKPKIPNRAGVQDRMAKVKMANDFFCL